MDTSPLIDRMKVLKKEAKQLRKRQREEVQTLFANMSKELFDKYPQLESFGFHAYTPYYNDGEECTYDVHSDRDEIEINGFSQWNDDGDDTDEKNLVYRSQRTQYENVNGKWQDVPNPHFDLAALDVVNDVAAFLQLFRRRDYKQMFGDHVQVNVTRDGVETERYDHD